ncbi:MAG: hypothetical protein KIT58_00005, partial [Planctomycetota bacterium]|nr:hypothetical protein [Planctomycetota bacterium]
MREVLRRGAPAVPASSLVVEDLLATELEAAGPHRRRVLSSYLRALERRGLVRMSSGGPRRAQLVALVLPEARSA